MYFSDNYLQFTRFLPNCSKPTMLAYLDQLLAIVQDWGAEPETGFNPEYIKLRFHKHYEEALSSGVFIESLMHLPVTKPTLWIRCRFWEYRISTAKWIAQGYTGGRPVRFDSSFYMTDIPHVLGTMEPPADQRNRYESLLHTLLHKNLADDIAERSPDRPLIRYLSIISWKYIGLKIVAIDRLSKRAYQTKSSCNAPSLAYGLAQKIEETLSSLPEVHSLYMEYTERDIFASCWERDDINDIEMEYNMWCNDFLSKYDEILLDAWGRKEFAKNLAPVGVTLEEWITVGNTPPYPKKNI